MKKKSIALLMAVVLLFGVVVGGTVAWLTAQSGTVANTFTVGDITITLDETNYENTTPARDEKNEYKMIPGNKYLKDPIVHVEEGSEPCYIFVELTETNNTYGTSDKVIQYEINDSWKQVEGTTNVYVYGTSNAVEDMTVVSAPADNNDNVLDVEDTTSVLKITNGTSITINTAVTATEFANMGTDTPKLVFKAYAIQAANVKDTAATATDIWALAKPATN